MRQKLAFIALLSCTACFGQSVPGSPADSTGTFPSSPAIQSENEDSTLGQRTGRTVDKTSAYPDLHGADTADPLRATTPHTPRVIGPLTTKSDFQQFAEDAAGRPLTVFGRQLFDEVPTTFAPVENVPVPADYVVGPGDQLLIRAWGKIDLDFRLTVDRNGQVYLPKVGELNVAGLRYDQLQGYLHASIGALFKDFELNVTLGQLRSIQIFILGNARRPGAYTVSSLSTLVNALFASGGPSATGTMRRIELRRGGRLVTDFDIYDLARKGDKSRDAQLLPGDVIYIPAIGPQIAIIGNVNDPGIYELKDESTVSSGLEGAGGLTSLAAAQHVQLERIENHSTRRIEEFALDELGLEKPLKDGDLLKTFPLSLKFENAITLRGNVAGPGRYVWKEGMRISDLIPSRDFLITRDYWNRQNHLPPGDAEHVSLRQRTDALGNEVPNQLGPAGPSLIDSVGQNGGEINWEYAVIERLDDRDLSTRLIPFRLSSAIDDRSSADNQPLKAGDVVTIFSKTDLELPMEKHSSFIRLGGEVNAPGVYRINPGETLRDMVIRAGGLTARSYLYASLLTRVSARRAQEMQLRQAAEKMQSELTSRYANSMPQAGQNATDQQAQFAMQQAALAKVTSIKPIGRVVLDMKPQAATADDIPEFSLEDGDTFYVPPRLGTVQVAGAVYNANAFRHQPSKRLLAYLDDAGGATREADQKRIFVIRADGTVLSRQSRNLHVHGGFDQLRLLPGDAIVVPDKIRVSTKLNDILQATQLASQTALTAAALRTILP